MKNLIAASLLSIMVGFPTIASADSYVLRINGLFCNLCVGNLMVKLKNMSGVTSAKLWLKAGIVVVNGNPNIGQIKSLIGSSDYKLIGAYKCKKPTSDVSKCKRV